MESVSTFLLIPLLVLCFMVKESSSDGIIYKTRCCHQHEEISDLFKTTPDFIEANGFIAEAHSVTTEDGYILTTHRIPGRLAELQNGVKRFIKPVVFLQHGIGATSDNWLLNGAKALPFLLANAGYDVWLGDSRGNHYSKKHARLSVNDPRYWDFSFHEQGYYDLAANIDYILRVTGQEKLFYIGHSRGTTMVYVLLSERPEYNNKFHLVISFAPVVYLRHSRSPVLRAIFDRTNSQELRRFVTNARALALPGLNARSGQFRRGFCSAGSSTHNLCVRILFSVTGFDYDQIDSSKIPVYVSHYPDGGALKEYIHFVQVAKSDRFRKFDYGPETNIIVYGQQVPPEYDLSRITAPITLHYGANDYFVAPEDLQHLRLNLRSVVGTFRVPYDRFNHIDFLWAKDADNLVYNPVIMLMNSFLKA